MSWKTKTVAEFKTDKVAYRSQLSIAPDGKKFRGVRKFIIKKDGKEAVTKDGLTFSADDKASILEVIKLLKSLVGSTSK